MPEFIECIECIKENKEDIDKGVKWNFPADVIFKGDSLCREHLFKRIKKKLKGLING